MRRISAITATILLLLLVAVEALDLSGFRRKDVDWGDAEIAKPPDELRSYLRKKGDKRRAKVVKKTIVISRPGVYDFKNVVHIARFSKHCDQKEGRPPMLHIRSGGVTVRNWIGVGTGHDGIHIHSGTGQGWKSRSLIKGVRFERCWQQACEDALTIGFRTRDIRFDRCGFLANPNGDHRDKLLQFNHADDVRMTRCYFAPTKNAIEFKSGAKIHLSECVFDHASTALRVDTSDSYRGIKPNQPTSVKTDRCRFVRCHHPAHLSGTVRWQSNDDSFKRTLRSITRDGAKIDYD